MSGLLHNGLYFSSFINYVEFSFLGNICSIKTIGVGKIQKKFLAPRSKKKMKDLHLVVIEVLIIFYCENDRSKRHDFWPRLWLFFSSLFFPPKKRGKRKGEWFSKNCGQKSCISDRSVKIHPVKISFKVFRYRNYFCVAAKVYLLLNEPWWLNL